MVLIAPHKDIEEKNPLSSSFHTGTSRDKDIPVDNNSNRQEAIQKVDEVSIGCSYKAQDWNFRGSNENIEYKYAVTHTEEAVSSNKHVDECCLRIVLIRGILIIRKAIIETNPKNFDI